MATAIRTTLKNYFQTGDRPSQAQYADLIDSKLNLAELGIQTMVGTLSSSGLIVTGHITASGDISASGQLRGNDLFLHDGNLDIQTGNTYTFNPSSGTGNITFTVGVDDVQIATNKRLELSNTQGILELGTPSIPTNTTASGVISASGNIIAPQFHIGGDGITPPVFITHHVEGDNLQIVNGGLLVQNNITASGDISASGDLEIRNITASGDISASGTIFASRFESAGSSGETISFNDHLSVTGNISASGDLKIGGNITASSITTTALTIAGAIFGQSTDTFWASGSSGEIYYNGGNVGIGTTTPGAKLEVVGNISASSTVAGYDFVGNNLILSAPSTVSSGGNIGGNITASGNISASGNVIANDITASGGIKAAAGTGLPTTINSNGINFNPEANGGGVTFKVDDANAKTTISGLLEFELNAARIELGTTANNHVTASGNISASGTVTAELVTTRLIRTAEPLSITSDVNTITFNGNAPQGIVLNAGSGHITASGDISASGTITANSFIGTDVSVSTLNATSLNVTSITSSIVSSSILQTSGSNIFGDTSDDTHTFIGNITASGDISSSGQFVGVNFGLDSTDRLIFSNNTLQFRLSDGSRITHTPTIFRPTSDEGVSLGRLTEKWKELVVNQITASGNISASGKITGLTGSFGRLEGLSPVIVGSPVAFSGPVTMSNQISSSGTIFADNAQFGSSTVFINGPEGQITASGDISSSGTVIADTINTPTNPLSRINALTASIAHFVPPAAAFQALDAEGNILDFIFSGSAEFKDDTNFQKVEIGGGAISASGTVTAKDFHLENGKMGINTGNTPPHPINSPHLEVVGDISASGKITGLTGSFGRLEGLSPITFGDDVVINGNLTASNNAAHLGQLRVGNGGYSIDETITIHSESGAYFLEYNPTGVADGAAYIYKSPPAGTIGVNNEHEGTVNGHIGLFLNNASFRIANSGGQLGDSINAASMSFAQSASISAIRFQNLPTSKTQAAQIGTGSLWLSGSADDGSSKFLLVYTG